MKLNLHPKEFLAIYSLLEQQVRDEFDTPVEASLKEVYNRMKSYLVSTLGRRDDSLVEDSFDTWEREQKKKIAELESKKDSLEQELDDHLANETSQQKTPLKPKSAKNIRFRN